MNQGMQPPGFPLLRETVLPGCFELQPFQQQDARGRFVKTFHEPAFRALGLAVDWKEEFVSSSRKGVLRGMHFQTPPHDYVKLVTCLAGRALDVSVDLRARSPTFGQCAALELSAEKCNAVYLPSGLAHGFLALEEGTLVHYKVTCAHAPTHDGGILWSSIPFSWPEPDPILSDRDRSFPSLHAFRSPFPR